MSRPSSGLRAGVDYPRNFIEFEEFFPDEEAAHRYLEGLRWPEGFRCPRCAETTAAWRSGRGLLICSACRQQVSVTAGTLFEKTRKPLRSWLHVAWEITNAKQGVNALTIQHRLGLRSLGVRGDCGLVASLDVDRRRATQLPEHPGARS